MRTLQERGELFKDEIGRWATRESLDWGSLPARIEATIAERIERLSEPEYELLSAASVQGDDFAGNLVAEVTGRRPAGSPEGQISVADRRRAGHLMEALAGIDAASAPDSLAGHCYRAELHRMRGELLLARDGLAAAGEALDCFERAMARGREKGALTWELRAAMSIVRLRESQGADHGSELAEARQGLAAVVARFTEGFGFPDLQEAAALLWGASA